MDFKVGLCEYKASSIALDKERKEKKQQQMKMGTAVVERLTPADGIITLLSFYPPSFFSCYVCCGLFCVSASSLEGSAFLRLYPALFIFYFIFSAASSSSLLLYTLSLFSTLIADLLWAGWRRRIINGVNEIDSILRLLLFFSCLF